METSDENTKTALVQRTLFEKGFRDIRIQILSNSTKTAQAAAISLGCTVGQIAKSLVFQGKSSSTLYLVVTSGINRVNPQKLHTILDEELRLASPDVVEAETGFRVGGIPPAGHRYKLPTVIDEDLMQYEEIWAAAGTEHSIFKLTPQILLKLTEGKMHTVS